MTVTLAILMNYRNRTNKNGLYPILIRVTIDQESDYYPVPLPAKVLLHC